MHAGLKPPVFVCLMSGIACLVRNRAHRKPFAAELKHLRHKRESIDTSLLVKRGENLVLAANLYKITGAVLGKFPDHTLKSFFLLGGRTDSPHLSGLMSNFLP